MIDIDSVIQQAKGKPTRLTWFDSLTSQEQTEFLKIREQLRADKSIPRTRVHAILKDQLQREFCNRSTFARWVSDD